MPTSVRVIRTIDNEYVVEVETEVEAIEDLFDILSKTAWGRKVLHLVEEMLPDIPEYKAQPAKEAAEAEEQRIKEYENKLREEGRKELEDELRSTFGSADLGKIKGKLEGGVREKYLNYIKSKRNPDDFKPKDCFLKYWERIEKVREEGGMVAMAKLAKLRAECDACVFKSECVRKSPKKG